MPLVTENLQYVVKSFILDVQRNELHVAYDKYNSSGTFVGSATGSITGENYVRMQTTNLELYTLLKDAVYNEVAVLEEVVEPWEVT